VIDPTDRISRKTFIARAGGFVAGAAINRASPSVRRGIRAVAFDGYAIFDATATIAVAEAILPGRGRDFVAMWRARMFDYQWIRTLGAQYAGFEETAADALSDTIETLQITVNQSARDRLLSAQLTLTPWPDAKSQLVRLHAAGVRLALLSNMSERMLDAGARAADIRDHFDAILSTDRVRAAKPDLRAYQMGPGGLQCSIGEIAFVAFAPWDVAGASWFGYRTIWLNRANSPAGRLGAHPVLTCKTLEAAASYVLDSPG
jgi:2-haloacid dehalogenase